jgi:uracil-DNA glycosylase
MKKNIQLKEGWKNVLQDEFKENYIRHLKQFLIKEKVNYTIYPKGEDIFNAFNITPFNNVKVVILGQDPYHGKGQAHGLSFSVPNEVKTPPSLVNIFKEIDRDLGIKNYGNGNLTKWAKQGVLLLNSTLTVRKDEAGSHQNKGWEEFTDKVISTISELKEGVIFLLWGKFAQNKQKLIDKNKHHILISSHPSPLSAYRGFLGCGHFSECNRILKTENMEAINWQL